jgi:hypothetical protein
VIDEQPESPSDHDFCLDSFSWEIKTGWERTPVNQIKRHDWDICDVSVRAGWSSGRRTGLGDKQLGCSQGFSYSQTHDLEEATYPPSYL